jgi:hypothetical protein
MASCRALSTLLSAAWAFSKSACFSFRYAVYLARAALISAGGALVSTAFCNCSAAALGGRFVRRCPWPWSPWFASPPGRPPRPGIPRAPAPTSIRASTTFWIKGWITFHSASSVISSRSLYLSNIRCWNWAGSKFPCRWPLPPWPFRCRGRCPPCVSCAIIWLVLRHNSSPKLQASTDRSVLLICSM